MIKNKMMFCLIISMFTFQLSFPCFAMFDGNEDGDIKSVNAIQQKMTFMETDKDQIDRSMLGSRPSQLMNFEDFITSWGSYLLSPVKVTIQMVNEVIFVATRNPKLVISVGLAYFIPVVVEACNCVCNIGKRESLGWGVTSYLTHIGMANGLMDCAAACRMANGEFSSCR